MKIQVIGSGEAFDGEKVNSSFLLYGSKTKLLVDCGFTVPHALWRSNVGKINAIYVTHFHGDHTFGIPALIVRMFEEKRTEPLIILGSNDIAIYIKTLVDNAYKGILSKLCFEIVFYECKKTHKLNELDLSFAETTHSVPNKAICVTYQNKSICISGDGAPTEELLDLYKKNKSTIIIQECFTLKKESSHHCSFEEILTLKQEHDFNFILTHLSRKEKKEIRLTARRNDIKVCEDGEIIFL